MEELFNSTAPIAQWLQMFVLAMGLLVFCSILSMISIWIVSSKLSEINNKLDKLIPEKDTTE